MQTFRIIILIVLLGVLTNPDSLLAQSAQIGGKKNTPSLLSTNATYRIKQIDLSQWCSRGVIRVNLFNEDNSAVERNHFSFGTNPGFGVQSVELITDEDSSEEVYELTLNPNTLLNFPLTLRHNREGFVMGNISPTLAFPIQETQWNEEIPSIAIIGANQVQVLRNSESDRAVAFYRWFKDGVLIGNRTSDVFNFSDAGSYSVQLVYTTGCVSPISTNLTFITNADEELQSKVKLYPVPAKDNLFIESQLEPIIIQIMDVSGRVVHSSSEEVLLHKIALTAYAKGIYYMKISFFQGKDSFIKKFVIQ